jgi:hypothetical protein
MKINLGAGNDILEGYINHDITKHRPEIDVAVDLNLDNWREVFLKKYNEMFEEIRAYDVLEHLNDPIGFMDNCWALLQQGGRLKLKACGWQNPNFWVDPTHKHAYDLHSLDYFDDKTELGQRYGYYTDKRWHIISVNYDRHMNIIAEMEVIK